MAKLHYKIDNKCNYKKYELKPLEGQQKSFYSKAIVEEYENGDKILYSYGTPIIYLTRMGVYYRLWGGWSSTTSKHVKAFIGKNIAKAEWERLQVCSIAYDEEASYKGWGVFSRG